MMIHRELLRLEFRLILIIPLRTKRNLPSSQHRLHLSLPKKKKLNMAKRSPRRGIFVADRAHAFRLRAE
jgi:hypothetical protein